MSLQPNEHWTKSWIGIDSKTRDFWRETRANKGLHKIGQTAAREWLISCRDAGLSTSLNADFADPAMARHLDERLKAQCYPGLVKQRSAPLARFRSGFKLYRLAYEAGLRQRPLPPIAMAVRHGWEVGADAARAKLPPVDQERLRKIEEILRSQALRHWDGRGVAQVRGPGGRRHRATISLGRAEMLAETVGYFLGYALRQAWEPFTLEGLLTPERVTRFLYYSTRYDGAGLQLTTIKSREGMLLDFFYRGRTFRAAPVVVITEEQEQKIRAEMAEEQLHRDQWNLADPRLGNTGIHKWYPDIQQVENAIQEFEDQIGRAGQRRKRGQLSAKGEWRQTRDAVLALCTLFCMWRSDTAATGSLMHLRRDPTTGAVKDEDGFAVIERIARAKDSSGKWYPFVPELILPPNVVAYIERLLALEGRSLEEPLRDGEKPVWLSAANGDHWGNTALPSGELQVVPIFRERPDRPAPLGYSGIRRVLSKQLERVRFATTNPHTLRAAGAIYWSFIQEMPEDLVMELGLWMDPKTLRENYAHINKRDNRRRIARYIVPTPGKVPVVSSGSREKAASAALNLLGNMLQATNARQAARLIKELRRYFDQLDQSVAAELGQPWERIRPDPLRPGEIEIVDEALRGAGYPRGLASVLGRDILARDGIESRAIADAKGPIRLLAHRRLLAQLKQLRTRPPSRPSADPRDPPAAA